MSEELIALLFILFVVSCTMLSIAITAVYYFIFEQHIVSHDSNLEMGLQKEDQKQLLNSDSQYESVAPAVPDSCTNQVIVESQMIDLVPVQERPQPIFPIRPVE